MYRNEEIVLQNKLIARPEEIEKNLVLKKRETLVGATKKRCDILFRDGLGNDLYVEVKEYIDIRAINQVNEYKKLVSNPGARFMLVSNIDILEKFRSQLNSDGIEYKWINKDRFKVESNFVLEVPKGNSKYETKENILKQMGKQRSLAEEITEYVSRNLHTFSNPIMFNISDGIMFQLIERNEKFLSISTIGNRLLFHFPISIRNEIFKKYKNTIPEIYCYREGYPDKPDKEQNQIDIKMKDIKDFDYIKPLINEAFNASLKIKR